jgi:GT2 family glycosyltransferase
MRVLAQITTFNAVDLIDRTIEALQQQTRPVDEILVVDNASSDGTLQRPSVRNVTVIRHQEIRVPAALCYRHAVCDGARL